LAALHDLQKIDTEILQFAEQRRGLIRRAQALEAEKQKRGGTKREREEDHKKAQVTHSAKETELQGEQEKLENFHEQLNIAKDANDYLAYEKQIDTTTERVGIMEEESIGTLLAIDNAKTALDKETAKYDAFVKASQEERRIAGASVKKHEAGMQARKAERAARAKGIDPAARVEYENWRRRRKTTMVAQVSIGETTEARRKIATYSCGECRMTIPPQLMLLAQAYARRHMCPSCSRVLYVAAVEADAEANG
jgi:predicted  nucleic acid-binding Zn-ribbon protein